MEHIIHTFKDTIVMLPFLFLVYLLIEYLEHKNNCFMYHLFERAKRLGPLLGAALGTIPQCGFSVIASELFAKHQISVGTLIAIFIATSDEAIPLMLAHPDRLSELAVLVLVKFIIAVLFGFLIDFAVKSKIEKHETHDHNHFHGNCESCEGGILKSAVVHAVKIFVYIFAVNIVLGFAAESIAPFMQFVSDNAVLQAMLTSLFGIIPNCAASVVLTELYLAGKITLAALIGGLCTGAGVGLIVLFKQNKNLKQNLTILAAIYIIGTAVGICLQFLK
ncbi:MAG: arsenic efflux protein [Clostridia bacterium]|nr:arsenic efflux protein [Clostridia bacterium]